MYVKKEDYYSVKRLMTNRCTIKCKECPLHPSNHRHCSECHDLEHNDTENALWIVQQWVNKNDIKRTDLEGYHSL